MPTRPCSIASAPTARTDGCTCPYGTLHTRNNRARSIKADFGPKKQLFSAENTHPWTHKAPPLEWATRAARAGDRGRGPCLRLRVPVPTHPRTSVGVYGTEKYSGRPDPPPAPRMHPPRRLMQPLPAPARRPDLRDQKWPRGHARGLCSGVRGCRTLE